MNSPNTFLFRDLDFKLLMNALLILTFDAPSSTSKSTSLLRCTSQHGKVRMISRSFDTAELIFPILLKLILIYRIIPRNETPEISWSNQAKYQQVSIGKRLLQIIKQHLCKSMMSVSNLISITCFTLRKYEHYFSFALEQF